MTLRPLNIFQRCIRVWEQAHPYNAAQILQIAGTPDHARITAAWNDALAASGLGVARVVGRRFCYETAPHQPVTLVGPTLTLDAYITQEINRPFDTHDVPSSKNSDPSTTMPFRPFVVPDTPHNAHHLGVFYQHWVADSISMRMLLREWFSRLFDPRHLTAEQKPLHIPRGGFWHYFGPHRAGWNLSHGVLSSIDSMSHFARARRIEGDPGPQHVACSLHRLPDGLIDSLIPAARRHHATVNDLLLAALARACDLHGAPPRRSPRDMGLGYIVDLRAFSPENLDHTFSLFLGFTSLVVKAEHLADPDRLLSSIARQNAHHKESRTAAVNMLRMAAGYAQAQFLSSKQLEAFYRNYMPVSGGVSNVNMNRSWPASFHPSPLLDYIRVAPTGPMVPVVIAATTLGNRFTFTLTRRASLVDTPNAARLAQTFITELTARS